MSGARGLRQQLILALVLPAFFVLAGVAYFADDAMSRALDDALGDRLTATARTGATIVDPKVLLLEPGEDDFRVKKTAEKKLQALATAAAVERVLVVRLGSDQVLVDTAGELQVGAEYVRAGFDRAELDAVARGESAASVLFEGPDGRRYKSGYAPLYEEPAEGQERGVVRGAVVVHAPAGFFAALGRVRTVLVVLAIIGFGTLLLLANASARGVTAPLAALSEAAARIGEGQLDTPIPGGGPSEAMVLSDTMRSMAKAIAHREEELQVMLAGIAHEVRNPLSGIELFGGLLKEDLEEGDPRRRSVDKILKQIGVLSGVVNDFLDFARKRPLDRRPLDLGELLEELSGVLRSEADAKAVALTVEAPRGLVCLIDRDPVQRAFLNLAKNAIQAAPHGGHVQLRAARLGAQVEVRVVDDGPGVPEAAREDVFRPFFTTKQKGTGLGLALVKKAIDAHGGGLAIEDTPGGGATFVVRLPSAPEDTRGPRESSRAGREPRREEPAAAPVRAGDDDART